MRIMVKAFATLSSYQPEGGELDVESGATVADVLRQLKLDPEEVTIIFVNGVHAGLDKPLQEGDKLGLFPPVGGG